MCRLGIRVGRLTSYRRHPSIHIYLLQCEMSAITDRDLPAPQYNIFYMKAL